MKILDLVKAHTPAPLREAVRRLKRELRWARDRRLPARAVFQKIYAEHEWGHEGTDGYYSGTGSGPIPARAYADGMRQYIEREGIRSIVDLGCGDYRVASLLVSDSVQYVGVDVVEDVIAANRQRYGRPKCPLRVPGYHAGPVAYG